jgi:hypothetical protein
MNELLLVFGRGVVKVLVSLLVGTGIGLVTFGISVRGQPEFWQQRQPPGELFLAVGVGLLSAGLLMMVMFLLPRLWKARPYGEGKGTPTGEWQR